jgi:hypothetical protein
VANFGLGRIAASILIGAAPKEVMVKAVLDRIPDYQVDLDDV